MAMQMQFRQNGDLFNTLENDMPNHEADIENKNKGTPGTNKTYDKNQGDRGRQIQEHLKKSPSKKTRK